MRPARIASRLSASAVGVVLSLVLSGSACFGSTEFAMPGMPSAQEDILSVSPFALSSVEEEDEEPARLALGPGGNELHLVGSLTSGIADRVAAFLASHPGVSRLHLESGGGLVGEGFGLAALVGAYGLDTEVSGECASACTLVYVRGQRRYLGPQGRLGFHGPYEVDFLGECRASDARSEREAYLRAGLDAGFVAQALAGDSETMWYPDTERLLSAGVVTGTTSTMTMARRDAGGQPGTVATVASAAAP